MACAILLLIMKLDTWGWVENRAGQASQRAAEKGSGGGDAEELSSGVQTENTFHLERWLSVKNEGD